jgi:transposase-like protein
MGTGCLSLGTWKRLYGKEASAKRSPAGEQQARIQYLEGELERVSRQRDILKKALGILGQEPGNFTK